jgi:hypothetical protein
MSWKMRAKASFLPLTRLRLQHQTRHHWKPLPKDWNAWPFRLRMLRTKPIPASADTAWCALTNIPEAIQHPRGLALRGSWSMLSGSHLTFTASEDFPANGQGGSANPLFL